MNVRLTESGFDRGPGQPAVPYGVVNGERRLLSSRRRARGRLDADGTPRLPYVGYDADGIAFESDPLWYDEELTVPGEAHGRLGSDMFQALVWVVDSERSPGEREGPAARGEQPDGPQPRRERPYVGLEVGLRWRIRDEALPSIPGENARRLERPDAVVAELLGRLGPRRERSAESESDPDIPPVDEGFPAKRSLMPDICVALDAVADDERTTYRIDQGEPTPTFILEILSPSTAKRDVGVKRELYRGLRIPELWLFDRRHREIPEGLRGLSLHGDDYEVIEPDADTLRRPSDVLPIELFEHGEDIRVYHVPTERVLDKYGEAMARADEQQQRANEQQELTGAQQRRAERAEEAVAKAEQRAAAAEAENARLRALLAGLGKHT